MSAPVRCLATTPLRWLMVLTMAAFCMAASPGARSAVITYVAALGPEAPGATGGGSVTLAYDDVAQTLAISAIWSGLSGLTTVAHIHCCTATPFVGTVGVAVTPGTLPGFPVGVTSGSYATTIDLTNAASFTGAFLTAGGGTPAGATALLLASLAAGRAYFNVHTSTFGGGEIRGFPQRVVPEPATLALFGLGLAGLAAARRRSRVTSG